MKKWQLGLTASVLSMLLLAGCGDDSEDNAGKSSGDDKETFQIGYTQIVEHASLDEAGKGFKDALKDKGVEAEYDEQSAQGDPNNAATIASKFTADGVDLIFANATPSAQSALNATKDIPIIFTSVTDPVGAKLVASMEAPGGNVTGTSDANPDAIPNTVKFIAEEMGAKTIGTVYNAGEQNSVVQIETMKAEAKKAGLELVEASVATSADVKQAAESLIGKADVIYIITDNTVVSALDSVVMVANEQDIPLFVGELDSLANGGFAAYGFDYYDIGYRAGEMAADILLNGKKPGEIPAEYPDQLKLVINKKAAEEMGIEIKPEWEKEAEFIE
ncbi:ABC transporter substrate-binding protein [Bacillus sp. AGMB 02131]|uniref:ABC transporter substrate-binding protein n=1 Tax=Peribacillus faecalis TaxID=2772559 RepID=A0A927HCP9_9BACI|nr:ABC transporter substrate-binding protein [Peribacillus faecalis]MBD3110274.1 ABC transporter substrate-binding protein [Peribacillus faecalis]